MYQFDGEKTAGMKEAHLLSICVLLLTGIGLVTLYTSSFAFATRFFGDGHYFVIRQVLVAGLGIAGFLVCSWINQQWIRKLVVPLLVLSAVLCFLTLIPGISVERLGASRWIRIGSFNYQPSEMVKLALPLYLAHIFDKKQDKLNNFTSGILPPLLVTLLFMGLIYMQNNFSTAVFITLNAMVIFFLAGLRYRYFIAAFVAVVPLAVLLIFTREHRVLRLASFIRPESDPLGAGYQVRSSLLTITSGGLWGKGIGHGTRKISSVPEIHSDFIFSAYAEETGFLGVFVFFVLFVIFTVLGYRAALRSDTVFSRLLATGLVTMIVSQVLLNVAVVSGALPATGIPLPFFSAGGSSLLTTLICAGLIVNIARKGGMEKSAASGSGGIRYNAFNSGTLGDQNVR